MFLLSFLQLISTYNSAYSKRLFFLFQNGIIEQVDNILTIKGPAINLDKKGFFKKPKIIQSFNVPDGKDYNLSLYKSVSFFIKTARLKKSFKKNLFKSALNSNKLVV